MASPDHTRQEYDCLYKEIELSGVLSKIIATEEFQRLKRIKQLGGVDYVFKDATHTRYQHSLGTAYLARKLVHRLRSLQVLGEKNHPPNTRIDDHDVRCIEIAALCHDLGHGPFSHVFQKKFLPRFKLEQSTRRVRSFKIFQHIWEKIIKDDDSMHDILNSRDMVFIEELIGGTKSSHPSDYKGRDETKWFLYDIMSNERSVVDVCKWDYIPRDCLCLGRTESENVLRLLNNLYLGKRENDGHYRIYYDEDKNSKTLLRTLHQDAYQRDHVNAAEHMICDALVYADKQLQLSSCFDEEGELRVAQFCKKDDTILQKIKDLDARSDSTLAKAQEILQRLESEQYYVCVQKMFVINGDSAEIIRQFSGLDESLNSESIKISVLDYLLKENTYLKMIQVFCVNPSDREKVIAACELLLRTVKDIFLGFGDITRITQDLIEEFGEFAGSS